MTTPNLGLVELTNSQGQYLNANETFAILDALVGKVVKDKDLNIPPGSPADGDVYIVGTSPTGLWASQANKITFWSADAAEWVFITPREGWKFEPVDEDITYRYSGSAWIEWSAGGGDWDALATPAISSGTLTINLADPTWYRVTLNQNVTTITFTNFPTGKVPVFAIEFVQDGTGGRTVVFPGSIVADDGGSIPQPATAAGAATVYTFSSSDNGTTYKYASGVENGFSVSVGAINEAPLVSMAAAATTNIYTQLSNTITITGNTTITSFGNATAGAVRRLIFTGTPVITHNATSLILPTSANITAAAGDKAEFTCISTNNWKCTDYSRFTGHPLTAGNSSGNVALITGSPNAVLGLVPTGGRSELSMFYSGADGAAVASGVVSFVGGPLTSGATETRLALFAVRSEGANANARAGAFTVAAKADGAAGTLGSDKLVVSGLDNAVRAASDNTVNLGTGALRWKEVFAGTGTINTSDGREKDVDQSDWLVRGLTADEIGAAKDLAKEIGGYRFLAAIQQKGESARTHIGMTVQRAIQIMESHGLDPLIYGFICHDTWEDRYQFNEAVYDEEGSVVVEASEELILAAGDRYGFRTDELLLFIAAGFEARISALENSV